MRPYTLDDRMWAGITRKLITVRNTLDAARSVKRKIVQELLHTLYICCFVI